MSAIYDVTTLPSDAPAPRLCRLVKRADFSGYGFNLHADKGKSGQYVGKVDDGSPADRAALKQGDRIVEVNGVNIGNENHQQVVQRIRAVDGETEFLVVDEKTDAYYSERNIVISSKLPSVKKFSSEGTKSSEDEEISDPPAKARLCHLRIWSDFAGYGFNLHVNKDNQLHFIGKIDDGSPAKLAGVRENDFLIEVNGQNVEEHSHGDVVKAIKEFPDHVSLLLVDEKAMQFFKSNDYKISHMFPFIEELHCPLTNPLSNAPPILITTAPDSNDKNDDNDNEIHPSTSKDFQANEVTTPTAVEVDEAVATIEAVVIHNEIEVARGPKPKLRLCIVRSWNDGQGFGFNMLSHKGKPGQFIENVDLNSPACLGGLKKGDLIVAVNGADVEGLSHNEVVDLIKKNLSETKLLVADAEVKDYYSERDIKLYSLYRNGQFGVDSVEVIECPAQKPAGLTNGQNKSEVDGADNKENLKTQERPSELILNVKSIPTNVTTTTITSSQSPSSPTVVIGGVEFAATAEEARKRMAKKKQAVAQQLSIQARYEMFQKM